MCERKSCRQGKPLQSPAILAEPRGDVVSKAQAVCTGTGTKLRGLVFLSHRICHIFGNECRISPRLQICLRMAFAFPLCRRSKGTGFALASPTHLPHHPPLLLVLWERPFMGRSLPPDSIRASLQFLAVTHMPSNFSGKLPSIYLCLMHKCVRIPGRQLLSQADVSKC